MKIRSSGVTRKRHVRLESTRMIYLRATQETIYTFARSKLPLGHRIPGGTIDRAVSRHVLSYQERT
jgi:hypothetical protein